MATVVQLKAATSATSVTFTSSTTSGNKIIVVAFCYDNGGLDLGLTDVTDNKSNTYTRRVVADNASITSNIAVYESQDSPTMGASHQVTLATHQDQGLVAFEISGLAATPFDKSGVSGVASSGSITTSSTGTLTQADEWVVAGCVTDQGNSDAITENAGEGWTLASESENGASELTYNVVYKNVAATTALTADWTLGGTHDHTGVIATFKNGTAAAGKGLPFPSTRQNPLTRRK